MRRTGLNIDTVPYRGTQPALTDLMGGSVQLLIDPSFALLPAMLLPMRVYPLEHRRVLARWALSACGLRSRDSPSSLRSSPC